jgi:hypothetical protein
MWYIQAVNEQTLHKQKRKLMRYRVLVEALKPTYSWIEIESDHPLDAIEPALNIAPNAAFVDAVQIEPGIGLQGSTDVESLLVLAVIDDSGTIHYTRSEQIDALNGLALIG